MLRRHRKDFRVIVEKVARTSVLRHCVTYLEQRLFWHVCCVPGCPQMRQALAYC